MTKIRDVIRQDNQNGRTGDTIKDGPFTLAIEVVQGVIVVTVPGDRGPDGGPLELHRNYDIQNDCRGDSAFVPRSIESERSGFDGYIIVTLFGFTTGTGDSRYITVKLDDFRPIAKES